MAATITGKLTSLGDATAVAAVCAALGLSAAQLQQLSQKATAAKATAYCVYSRFRVGAALLAADGETFVTGANVENASYPVGTCAERVAMGRAVVEGVREFKAVAVATDISPPASPCGMCRQLSVSTLLPPTPSSLFDLG